MTNTTRPSSPSYEELSLSRALRLFARGATLRCPHCGGGRLLESWFRFKPKCEGCGLRLDRGEEDFFLGGMMWNIVLAEGLLALAGLVFVLLTWPDVPWTTVHWTGIALMIIAPFLFYPLSLTIWLASDILIRPVTEREMEWHRGSREGQFREFRDR